MADKCKSCIFSCPVNIGDESEMMRACVYILYYGERRPCPAGEKCTVYREEKARR